MKVTAMKFDNLRRLTPEEYRDFKEKVVRRACAGFGPMPDDLMLDQLLLQMGCLPPLPSREEGRK